MKLSVENSPVVQHKYLRTVIAVFATSTQKRKQHKMVISGLKCRLIHRFVGAVAEVVMSQLMLRRLSPEATEKKKALFFFVIWG